MAGANTLEFTDANFDDMVVNSDRPVLVDFWAEWCPPCRAIAPTVTQLADEYEGRAKVGKLDVDAHQQTAGRYGVRSIPTLLVFQGGEEVGRFVGVTSKQALGLVVK